MGLLQSLLGNRRALRYALQAALLLAGPAAGAAAPATAPGNAPVAAPAGAPGAAASPGLALVIGNATYAALPPLPACALSAHTVAAALRRLGFQVIAREDATLGQVDGAIGTFATRLAAAPTAPAVVYLCGYAAGLNGRSFYLPVSAKLTQPTDVLTQGVLTTSLLSVLAPRPHAAAVMALDLTARPEVPGPPDLGMAEGGSLPAPLGMVVVRNAGAAGAPTPLASALVAGLAGPEVRSGRLVAGLGTQLAKAGPAVTVVVLHPPVPSLFLAGTPAPPPAATPAPRLAPPPAALPAEADMTAAQRRDIQTALARLGYYDGAVDGLFGADTRAAIRRFQHEIHAPMTGRLTAAEATRLITRNLR